MPVSLSPLIRPLFCEGVRHGRNWTTKTLESTAVAYKTYLSHPIIPLTHLRNEVLEFNARILITSIFQHPLSRLILMSSVRTPSWHLLPTALRDYRKTIPRLLAPENKVSSPSELTPTCVPKAVSFLDDVCTAALKLRVKQKIHCCRFSVPLVLCKMLSPLALTKCCLVAVCFAQDPCQTLSEVWHVLRQAELVGRII